MDPWDRWGQGIGLIAKLSDMVKRGLEITEARAHKDAQFRRQKHRPEEARFSDDTDFSSLDHNADGRVSLGGGVKPTQERLAKEDKRRVTSCLTSEKANWIHGAPPSSEPGIETVSTSEDSVNEERGLNHGSGWKNDRVCVGGGRPESRRGRVTGPWWILGSKSPTEADFIVYGFLATTMATRT